MLHLLSRSVSSLALTSILASLAAGAAAQAERQAAARPPLLADKPAVHLGLPRPILLADKPDIPVQWPRDIVLGEQRAARVDPPRLPAVEGEDQEAGGDPDLGRRPGSPAVDPLPASASADAADLAPSRPSTEPPLVVVPFLSMALSTDRELTVLVEGFGPFYCAVLLADRPDLVHSFFVLPPLLATGSIVFTGKAAFGSFVDQMVVPKYVDVSIYGQALIWSPAGLASSPVAVVDPIE